MKSQRFMKTLRQLFLVVLVGMLSVSTVALAAPGDDVTVTLDGEQVAFDQPPVIQEGRTLVPMRAIFEAMGASVDWDGATRTVTSTRGDVTIVLTIDSSTMTRNGQAIALDVPAQILNGRTLVPIRAIGDAFGADVKWDGATRSVTIVSDAETPEEPVEPFGALAYERYPGDENAPEWMVAVDLVKVDSPEEEAYFNGDESGALTVYVTKPADMTSEQWETLKKYYSDKPRPTCLWPDEGNWTFMETSLISSYAPVYQYRDTDDLTTNFA